MSSNAEGLVDSLMLDTTSLCILVRVLMCSILLSCLQPFQQMWSVKHFKGGV